MNCVNLLLHISPIVFVAFSFFVFALVFFLCLAVGSLVLYIYQQHVMVEGGRSFCSRRKERRR